ncbi:MAG: hypothetical protein LC708_00275, partial [Actinobacteria bacterium]|nr:hypothetical protein [Actinomycetota bacterium]
VLETGPTGTVNITVDVGAIYNCRGGVVPRILNRGTMVRSGPAGALAVIDIPVDNMGTIRMRRDSAPWRQRLLQSDGRHPGVRDRRADAGDRL